MLRVLFKQLGIISHPCRLANIKNIEQAAICCCILNNMTAQIRGYKSTVKFRRELEQRVESKRGVKVEFDIPVDECRYTQEKTVEKDT